MGRTKRCRCGYRPYRARGRLLPSWAYEIGHRVFQGWIEGA